MRGTLSLVISLVALCGRVAAQPCASCWDKTCPEMRSYFPACGAGKVDKPKPRAEPPPKGCPDGQAVTADTDGHCCWAGQAWSKSRVACLGAPTRCPPGRMAKGDDCAAGCPDGMEVSAETSGHCCWPGQVWSRTRGVCLGTPIRCPPGRNIQGDDCGATAVAREAAAGAWPTSECHLLEEAFRSAPAGFDSLRSDPPSETDPKGNTTYAPKRSFAGSTCAIYHWKNLGEGPEDQFVDDWELSCDYERLADPEKAKARFLTTRAGIKTCLANFTFEDINNLTKKGDPHWKLIGRSPGSKHHVELFAIIKNPPGTTGLFLHVTGD